MFFVLLLFMIGSACIIGMPILHSSSLYAYKMAEKANGAADDKLERGMLGTAAWCQASCYFLGVCGSLSFVWCGIEFGKKFI